LYKIFLACRAKTLSLHFVCIAKRVIVHNTAAFGRGVNSNLKMQDST